MGFKPKKTMYRLVFKDPDMDGLVVIGKALSMGKTLQLQQYATKFADVSDKDGIPPEMLDEMLGLLTEGLAEWNVEDDDDQPVPLTDEGILTQEIPFIMKIIYAYGAAMGQVKEELGKESISGSSFPEASIPMETSSTSLAS